MKALVFSNTKKLVYKTVPKPKIRKNETLIKVLATGICGSDMHAFNGLDKVKKKPPIILGHEVIGIDLHNNKYCTISHMIMHFFGIFSMIYCIYCNFDIIQTYINIYKQIISDLKVFQYPL